MSTIHEHDIVKAFKILISRDVAVPVAAMNALLLAIKNSHATTWMNLELELRQAIEYLKHCDLESLGGRTSLSLTSGCELFMKYVTRTFNIDAMEFSECKKELLKRGERFAGMSLTARVKISEFASNFIQDDSTVLIHGNSRVVTTLLLKAAKTKQFKIIITEGRPQGDGVLAAQQYLSNGIPTTLILDCGVGAILDQIDIVLVGAEAVMENGGIVNKIGTYQLAIIAKALKKPFYVAVESYKFARLYPLSQRDVAATFSNGISVWTNESSRQQDCEADKESLAANLSFYNHSSVDFTPASYISLLFTDLGVLTPAAVFDEMIKLYQ